MKTGDRMEAGTVQMNGTACLTMLSITPCYLMTTSNPKSATFEFTQDAIIVKIILACQ